jgi:hypothetical protein
LRISSGEFIRSRGRTARYPARIRNGHHSLLHADGTLPE